MVLAFPLTQRSTSLANNFFLYEITGIMLQALLKIKTKRNILIAILFVSLIL